MCTVAQDRSDGRDGVGSQRLTPTQRARLSAASVHAELFVSTQTGEPIRVRCTCSVGADHWSESELVADGGRELRDALTAIESQLRRRR